MKLEKAESLAMAPCIPCNCLKTSSGWKRQGTNEENEVSHQGSPGVLWCGDKAWHSCHIRGRTVGPQGQHMMIRYNLDFSLHTWSFILFWKNFLNSLWRIGDIIIFVTYLALHHWTDSYACIQSNICVYTVLNSMQDTAKQCSLASDTPILPTQRDFASVSGSGHDQRLIKTSGTRMSCFLLSRHSSFIYV